MLFKFFYLFCTTLILKKKIIEGAQSKIKYFLCWINATYFEKTWCLEDTHFFFNLKTFLRKDSINQVKTSKDIARFWIILYGTKEK